MAKVKMGVRYDYAGVADEFICDIIPRDGFTGVQLVVDGADVSGYTVEVRFIGSDEFVTVDVSGAVGRSVRIAKDLMLTGIRVTGGVAAVLSVHEVA